MKNFTLIVFLFIANLQNINAQFIYPNDDCTGARPIFISNTGELFDSIYQRNNYADGAISSLPNCAGVSNVRHDLWYTFIAPDDSMAVVPEYYSGYYQLFTGTCGALTSVFCSTSPTVFPKPTGLVPGQRYYLRTYHDTNIPITSGSFASNFKLSLLSPPVNDVCTNALLMPTNPLYSSALPTRWFTNDLATPNTGTGCVPSENFPPGYEDVWFKFVATNTAHSVYAEAPVSDTRFRIYSGSPGSLVSIALYTSGQFDASRLISLTGLTPGQTYHIRVGAAKVVKFGLSIAAGTPKNDDCINADTIAMSSSFNAEKIYSFKRIGATNSSTPCPQSSPSDVWFIFQATTPNVTVKAVGDYTNAVKLGLMSGNCGALTCLVNGNSSTINYSGLTVGNYYYISAGEVSLTDKQVYLSIMPRITNDECAGAVTIPVKPYNKIKTTLGNIDGATSSMPDCSGQADEDVWFKFTANDTTLIITADGETAYPTFQVFSGSCGALISMHCSSQNVLPPGVYQRTDKVRGFIPGNLYYVKYLAANGGGYFTLDVNNLPANDACEGATSLVAKQNLVFESMNDNGVLQASPSMAPCISTTSTNDIWYKFTATSATAAVISDMVGAISPAPVTGLQVYSGNCAALNSIVCFEQGSILHKAQTLTGLTPGQTYYIRQYGNFAGNRIGVINPPANDEISGAVKLIPAPTAIQAMPSYYLHGASKKFGKICAASPSAVHHDVWFYFVAEAASHAVSVNTFNSFWAEQVAGYTYRIEAFRGYATDSLTLASKLINCAATSLTLSSLTPGDTVYVRVANTSAEGNTSIFSMKLSNTQNIDEPTGALTLTKTDSYQYSLTTAGATQSLPAMGCRFVDFPDDDIWMKFTATGQIKRVIAGSESRDVTIQLFSGTPGNLTHVLCSNNIMVLPNNLYNGEVYYLRVYSKVQSLTATFQIGLFGEESMLANDCGVTCVGANLVANPRCETEYEYLLPKNDDGGEFLGRKIADGWWSGNFATADSWNADYPTQEWGNVAGNTGNSTQKIPRSGKGMFGLLNHVAISWQEYITGKLSQPLVQGKTYFVSFYVSIGETSMEKLIPQIGAFFSNDSIAGIGRGPLQFTPHISNLPGDAITEQVGWRNICGLFYADKPYSYITVGNFGVDNIYSPVNRGYFFVDDVVVAETQTCTPLPLTLLNFRGRSNAQKQSELSWETTNEINTASFDVEWRTDASSFKKVGTVQAKGDATTNRYQLLHATPADGYNYYRLKMNDKDGKFSYSAVVRLGNKSNGSGLMVFPNPFASTLYLNAQAEKDEMVVFSLIQTDGRVAATRTMFLKKGSNAFNWNVGDLAAGNYFITSTNKTFATVQITKE